MEEMFCQISNFRVGILNGKCYGTDLTSDLYHVIEYEMCKYSECVLTHTARLITQSVCVWRATV